MNTTNLEERRCKYDVLITREAQNLKEHRGSCMEWISQRDAHGLHKVAVKHTSLVGETYAVCRESGAWVDMETNRSEGLGATQKYPRINLLRAVLFPV